MKNKWGDKRIEYKKFIVFGIAIVLCIVLIVIAIKMERGKKEKEVNIAPTSTIVKVGNDKEDILDEERTEEEVEVEPIIEDMPLSVIYRKYKGVAKGIEQRLNKYIYCKDK